MTSIHETAANLTALALEAMKQGDFEMAAQFQAQTEELVSREN